MADKNSTAGHPSAGQGRLAQLIATRGGQASPEAPFVIEHREALIYMLCEAAELEHGIMCQYLYAAFSLKQGEGLAGDRLAAVQRWRSRITHVATQEMLHLALVHNLLSAIGAAPHLTRPNLPQPANYYPAGPPAPEAKTSGAEGLADDAPPGPGEPVGFAAHIKPLFRARDRQSMSFAFDLWSYDDVRTHAADIARRLHDGTMPCDGAWSAARIEVFQRWTGTGLRP